MITVNCVFLSPENTVCDQHARAAVQLDAATTTCQCAIVLPSTAAAQQWTARHSLPQPQRRAAVEHELDAPPGVDLDRRSCLGEIRYVVDKAAAALPVHFSAAAGGQRSV